MVFNWSSCSSDLSILLEIKTRLHLHRAGMPHLDHWLKQAKLITGRCNGLKPTNFWVLMSFLPFYFALNFICKSHIWEADAKMISLAWISTVFFFFQILEFKTKFMGKNEYLWYECRNKYSPKCYIWYTKLNWRIQDFLLPLYHFIF